MEDQSDQKVLERLLLASNSNSEAVLASRLGISSQSIYNARKKGQIPPGWILDIAKTFNVSSDWLFFGVGSMHRDDEATYLQWDTELSYAMPETNERRELTLVPLVEAVLSAGGGSFETEGRTLDYFSFHARWLKRKGQVKDMVLMRVSGDSMQPIINNKDIVLIDQSQRDPRAGMVYAVTVEDVIYLKKLNTLPGKLVLTSYNKEYAPIEVATGEHMYDTIKIIGRAVWWCHEA